MTVVDPRDALVVVDDTEPSCDWIDVADVGDVIEDRGVAVLVAGRPVAVFRLRTVADGSELWVAVDHVDPLTGSPVIARGLVGSLVDGTPTVASPIHKQRYDLLTGRGIDDDSALSIYAVRRTHDRVLVGVPRAASS
ncbi:MAG: nitrite reductase (NAD(P)H) small subunit [Actinomycetota bacterium]